MANRGSYPNIATRIANQQAMVDAGLAANDTCTVDGTSFTWDGTGWQSPYPAARYLSEFPKPNHNAAYKIHGGAKNSSSLDITNADYSLTEQHPALGEFWQYRPYVFNHDTVAKTLRVAKSAGAPTDKHNGSGLSWITHQTNGVDVANAVIPAATFVSASDQDVDDITPAIVGFDRILASPVARTDAGTAADLGLNPLMLSRTAWINGVRPLSALDPDWRARTGLLFKGGGSSYDFVSSNAAFAPTDVYNYQTTFIEYSYVKPTLAILTDGDSTLTGVTTTSGRFAPIDEAARLSRLAGTSKLMVPLKFASSGRRSAGFVGTLPAVLAAGVQVSCQLIPWWTVNDGSEAAQFALSRAVALRLIDQCERNGVIPILVTPAPYDGLGTGSRRDAWRAARAEALSMASQMLVCDMAGRVCDTSTGQFLPGASNDGTHYNDNSTPIIGAELFSTTRQLL
jgi:hypothetical protein